MIDVQKARLTFLGIYNELKDAPKSVYSSVIIIFFRFLLIFLQIRQQFMNINNTALERIHQIILLKEPTQNECDFH